MAKSEDIFLDPSEENWNIDMEELTDKIFLNYKQKKAACDFRRNGASQLIPRQDSQPEEKLFIKS